MQLILASGSPRRAAALVKLGVSFTIDPPEVDERARPGEDPATMAERLAVEKSGIAEPGTVRLALDTVVVVDGTIIGKPVGAEDAIATLLQLAGRTHQVVSGWALATVAGTRTGVCVSEVRFRRFDRHEAMAYVATGEPMDKAGSYAIQGFGRRFIAEITGSVSNVMGFPVEDLLPVLRSAGVSVANPDATLVSLGGG